MPKLPVLTGHDLLRILQKNGFQVLRSKGSHFRLVSNDERYVTVSIHGTKSIPKGLLRKIIREDIQISLVEFLNWVEND